MEGGDTGNEGGVTERDRRGKYERGHEGRTSRKG